MTSHDQQRPFKAETILELINGAFQQLMRRIAAGVSLDQSDVKRVDDDVVFLGAYKRLKVLEFGRNRRRVNRAERVDDALFEKRRQR